MNPVNFPILPGLLSDHETLDPTLLTGIINSCEDLTLLTHIYNASHKIDHPHISFSFGVSFLILGDKVLAREALIKGASFGIQYPSMYYDHYFIDSIGQCYMLLVTQYSYSFEASMANANALGYLFLSRCIEITNKNAYDSYHGRGALLKNNENVVMLQSFINFLGLKNNFNLFIISDYYHASQINGTTHKDDFVYAKRLHEYMGNIEINDKNAYDYSTGEMAEIGANQHYKLFKLLEQEYVNGNLNITIEDLEKQISL